MNTLENTLRLHSQRVFVHIQFRIDPYPYPVESSGMSLGLKKQASFAVQYIS